MKPIYKCGDRYVEEEGDECILLLDPGKRLRLRKLLSAILRHVPGEAGLKLGPGGWVSIEELAEAIRTRWRNREMYKWVTAEHILAVAVLDPKGRFEVYEGRIRARYGHSVPVSIEYKEDRTISRLFHGTRRDRLAPIFSQGLKPMKRLYVHLSPSIEAACETARRHGGIPVYLEIHAECLRRRGIKVYRASPKVFLAPYVPPECIKGWRKCSKDASS
jgi:putative RNA 2'-phosphotransferase